MSAPAKAEGEDDQLAAVGYIHYIEVVRVYDMSRQVGQYAKHEHYGHRYAGQKAVQTVREVGSVGYGRDDEYRHEDIEYPCRGVVAARKDVVVELGVLHERNRGLGALLGCGADDALLIERAHAAVLDILHGLRLDHLVAHHDVVRCPHHRSYDDAQTHLPDHLEAAVETLLIVAEHLDVVVQTADESQP